MLGNLDKSVYQTRRAELNRTADTLRKGDYMNYGQYETERRLKDSQMAWLRPMGK